MPSFPRVQSVVRASRLLQELNRLPVATIDQLHKATKLPKPTVVRLLETLMHQGFVAADPAGRGYVVASGVTALSAGYHGGPLLIEAGRACCVELTQRHKWPTSIGVLDGAEVALVFSTIPDSPMAPFRPMLARRRSLLTTAMGRAYLAFCDDDERALLVKMLVASKADGREADEIEAAVRDLVRHARHQGYAERDPRAPWNAGSTVAMPVRHDGRILGMVGVGYFKSAVRDRDIEKMLVAPLREAIGRIERNVADLIGADAALAAPAMSRTPSDVEGRRSGR